MSSCCNPLLHDMQALTASAVSCIDPVVSRLQAASAEVAVAKLFVFHDSMLGVFASHLITAVLGLEAETPA